jgi:ABC-2 type transport system ATP-binding protein
MRELRAEGTTILLATHDMAEASDMANRVGILLRGRIAAVGTPLEITATGARLTKISVRTEGSCLSNPAALFPSVEKSARLDEYFVYFSADVGRTVSALIAFVNAQSDPLIDLRVERPSLEDRFLEITSEGSNR